MTDSFKSNMYSSASELGVGLDEDKLTKLYVYYDMLVEKNKVMNLTSITDEADVVIKHFADSLSIVKTAAFSDLNSRIDGMKLIDVGTGAGFPGLVLKIAFPGLKVVLFDSLNKRLKFLDEVIDELKLGEVQTVHGRAEDYGHDKIYRERFDIAVSRAVANMSTLCEYCLPFVRQGGLFVAYKSAGCDEEFTNSLSAIKLLGGQVTEKCEFMLPGTNMGRSLITISKVHNTPSKYPRKAGTPASDPLG